MRCLLPLLFVLSAPAFALGQLLPTPVGSAMFGKEVVFLPNGNFVITDPGWSGAAEGMGAVYLYASDATLISRLTGAQADDNVGSGGIVVLANGNFVVRSPFWDGPLGDDVGAVTFGDADAGFGGNVEVDSTNSLVGSQYQDDIGSSGIVALPNGNYVVASERWDNGAPADAGAVTWGDGAIGTIGVVGVDNSLVGTHAGDHVGASITVLGNGNYVVASPQWDDGATVDAGAVTLRSGTSADPMAVAAGNSLVGGSGDRIGSGGVIALGNGHAAIASPLWDNGAAANAGAVTCVPGDVIAPAKVTAQNSLHGSNNGDRIGSGGLIALAGGGVAFASPEWDRDAIVDAGAVSVASGQPGCAGAVTASSSMVGAAPGDRVGSGGLSALPAGGFVALSPVWDDGAKTDAGAATFVRGDGTTVGSLDSAASLRGNVAGDLQFARVTVLANGNYVVSARFAQIGGAPAAGAVAWCPGDAPCAKLLDASTALVGSRPDDGVGAQQVLALADGNYVVASPFVDTAMAADVGAVTWADGQTGATGAVDASNSMLGRAAGDAIGAGEFIALPSSDYFILSPLFAGPGGVESGAITFAQAGLPLAGSVDENNSWHAPSANDRLGFVPRAVVTGDGRAIIAVPQASDGGQPNAGAVVVLDRAVQAAGALDYDTGIRGAAPPQGGFLMRFDWHEASQTLVASDPLANRVWLAKLGPGGGAIFRDGFED